MHLVCHEVIVGSTRYQRTFVDICTFPKSARTFVDLQIIDLNRFNINKPGIPFITQQQSEIELNSIPELVYAPNSPVIRGTIFFVQL